MRRNSAVKITAILLLIGVGSLGPIVAWGMRCMQAPAIPSAQMAQIHDGMSSAEVQRLLGSPTTAYVDAASAETTWTYSRGTWAIYYIVIGSDGTVIRHHHDY